MSRQKKKVEDRPRSRTRKKDRNRDHESEKRAHKERSRERRIYERVRSHKGGERECWEFHNVALTRVPGYGFGIAVSGGRDNSQFSNGDPSIAISDVLKAGPAEGKLRINDRVISANGISLENVDYATAVQVLRECGVRVNLAIKRRVLLPPNINEPQTLKVTVTKSKKKDDFGIVLGCWIYVKEITNRSLLEKDGTVHEGDIVTKINSNSTDCLTLKEAKKLIENTKEKLHLVVRREPNRNSDPQQSWPMRSPTETLITHNKDLPPSQSCFIDSSTNRPHWSNQNLYVQSPTRGDYRLTSERINEKNNLTRPIGNWNHALAELSINHLEHMNQMIPNTHSPTNLEDMHAPPRPPLPHLEGIDSRSNIYSDHSLRRVTSPPDPRFISFQKDGSVGIRLAGGNEVGVFVTGVQPGSPAFLQGLQPGDKILKVNDIEMRGFTKEEAVTLLLGIQDQVNLIVQHRKEEYEDVMTNKKGDSFYVRTHFCHESSGKGELNFRKGEIFHVVDTLYNGNSGSWLVFRLGRNGQEIQRGIIPNASRARELAHEHQTASKKDADTESRGSFFRRRARRSKSLCKDHWEDVVLADSVSKFPAYERVVLKQPGFIRPVVLFGPLTDIVKDRLLKDYPECYASPQSDNQDEDEQNNLKSSGIIRLSAIRDVIEKGKHGVLDITPSAVDRLNYAQFYPIVIFMHAENKHIIKELRAKWAKSSYKSSRKLYEHAVKLEKLWSHIFTATISLTIGDSWYKKLQETIDRQQKQPLWVSEAKPDEAITDDFLFPMTSRLSYASSPESDLDLSIDSRSTTLKECLELGDRRLIKSSSDPSITGAEEMADTKSYGQYPTHSLGRNGQLFYPNCILQRETAMPIQAVIDSIHDLSPAHGRVSTVSTNDNGYEPQFVNFHNGEYNSNSRSRIDPYATLTPSERIANQINGQIKETYQLRARFMNSQSPPAIDRSIKPLRNYIPGRSDACDLNTTAEHDYINTMERYNSTDIPQENINSFDNSLYNGESNSFPSSSLSTQSSFAISSGQGFSGTSVTSTYTNCAPPYQSMTLDRARLLSSKTRQDVRPPPPPPPVKPFTFKPRLADGRPIPPPKPVQYHGKNWQPLDSGPENSTRNLNLDSSIRNDLNLQQQSNRNMIQYHSRSYPTSPSKPPPPPKRKDLSFYKPQSSKQQSQDNAGDSGHGDSPERSLVGHSYSQDSISSNPSSPYSRSSYSNVRFGEHIRQQQCSPPTGQHSPPLPPPPSGLDLASRENRGSAFELYKKPDAQSVANTNHITSENQKRYCLESPNATHSVVATAEGVFGSSGGVLTSKETGVTVIIPPGAISEGEEHEIYFKVCQDTNMLPPLDRDKGETLLSPLVMCGPHGLKFNVPIELRLPHCASISPDSWSFALKSSDTSTGEPAEWQNVSLDNKDGVASSHVEKDYVSVLVDHF